MKTNAWTEKYEDEYSGTAEETACVLIDGKLTAIEVPTTEEGTDHVGND